MLDQGVWLNMIVVLGRVGLALLFILGGINKLANYGQYLNRIDLAGLPFPDGLLPLVIFLEIGGGLAVAFGRLFLAPFALALAAFTLATNIVFHDFWTMSGDIAELQLSLFFKNVSIAGALMLLAAITLKDRSR
ncbi:MAG: DoxX family protein [Erythrobacter sp.]